jgi:putative DNA primase/helicase
MSASESWSTFWADAKAADMVAVAQALGAKLKRQGREMVGHCPTGCTRNGDGLQIDPGKRVFLCRPSGAKGDVIALVEHLLACTVVEAGAYLTGQDRPGGFGQIGPEVERLKPPPRPAQQPVDAELDRSAPARQLWAASVDPRGTPAEIYLKGRGLALSADLADEVLRWNPRIGAVLALFRNIHTAEPQAVSRTFLDAAARKIERKFLGPVGGAAIMLDAFDDVLGGLHICEGVENGLVARQLGLRPTWALGSASAVAAFSILGGVECLTILSEDDAASAAAVQACGTRWTAVGREVLVNQAIGANDLNDALLLARSAR